MKYKKFIATTINAFLNENKKFKIGDIISSKEMVKYIEDNKLRDSFGIIMKSKKSHMHQSFGY